MRTHGRTGTARATALLAAAAFGVAGCGSVDGRPEGAPPASSPPTATSASASASQPGTAARPKPVLPSPNAPITRDSSALADDLERTTAALRDAIDEWTRRGDPDRGRPPEPVVLLALHQQRIYRLLARHPRLAERTVAALPRSLATQARDNVAAGRKLRSLTDPISDPATVRTQRPLPAGVLRRHFTRAERRFGVAWEVLAAVMYVETKFGRVRSPSSAGAQGPMQFMPATWDAYGMGGDVHDTGDAVLGAANYLRASGAPGDYPHALDAYNSDQRYVGAVLRHARQIRRDPRNYYAYYCWQVFVRTTHGDRRLTGP